MRLRPSEPLPGFVPQFSHSSGLRILRAAARARCFRTVLISYALDAGLPRDVGYIHTTKNLYDVPMTTKHTFRFYFSDGRILTAQGKSWREALRELGYGPAAMLFLVHSYDESVS